MAAETAGDVLSGVLRLTFGGQERECPTLKIRASREWLKRTAGKMPLLIDALGGEQDAAGQRAFVDFTYDAGLDAILDYDQSGALGGREWLEEHADPAELYAALRAMARVAVPFGDDLQSLLALLLAVVPDLFDRPTDEAGASSPPSSTSSPSAPGTSTRTRSRRASTRGS